MLADLVVKLQNGTKRLANDSGDENLDSKRPRTENKSPLNKISTRTSTRSTIATSEPGAPGTNDAASNRRSPSFPPFVTAPANPDNTHPILGTLFVQSRCQNQRKIQRDFPQCMACTSRQSFSGGCKFASIRAFKLKENATLATSLDTPIFLDDAPFTGRNQREATKNEDVTYSTLGSLEDVQFLRSSISGTLEKVVTSEVDFEDSFKETLVRRRREAGVRPVCDGCATTIFSGHFMCCVCGRELCLDCYYEWDDSVEKGFENVASCSRRQRHHKRVMVPFTFAKEGEMQRILNEVRNSVQENGEVNLEKDFSKAQTEGFLPFIKMDLKSIQEEDFRSLWSQGEPLVITGCLNNFKIPWTPDHFIENYGTQRCLLVDCNTESHITSTVETFFQEFPTLEPKRPLKLKDWPPIDDFAEIFPELFNDFENALPFPRYTRRKGFMNLVARFPKDLVVPDLGPKMYNAHASNDGLGGKGTTRLHLDITDAVNIMTYAAPNVTAHSRGGAAVWDIFPADATDTLRSYLGESVSYPVDDPVLRQQFYISRPQLDELREKHNIKPWRIHQNPGDAVFIPAGCAHQVCNLTSCIKVACDFVSGHCIMRCRELIDGNRKLAKVRGGAKEDVLQLKTMLMCAWEEMGRWEERNKDTNADAAEIKDE